MIMYILENYLQNRFWGCHPCGILVLAQHKGGKGVALKREVYLNGGSARRDVTTLAKKKLNHCYKNYAIKPHGPHLI